MLQSWFVVGVALGYIGLLFVIASYGDRTKSRRREGRMRGLIYPLSLAVYCTSWTFFGSVGFASRSGWGFLAIYVGPMLMMGLCYPLVLRIARLAKAQNITSIADFMAARYGKHQAVAATVVMIAVIGTVPYIALQLKAVSSSLGTILAHVDSGTGRYQPHPGDLAFFVALAMAAFAALFGTRQIDATEHQDGLMLAIATESIVKLVALTAVGVFVAFVLFDSPAGLVARAIAERDTSIVLSPEGSPVLFATMTVLSFAAIVLLPRQFHVTFVENQTEAEIRRAAWLFPLYLVLINLFVMPIALAGLIRFPSGTVDSDMFVLALPLAAGSKALGMIAFIGGLSAATAMVIVECVALAIMVSNDIFIPLVLRRRGALLPGQQDVTAALLGVRRIAILLVLALAYVYYAFAGEAQLASIGLLSFAAMAQLGPAFFGGLVWRNATARGALFGMFAGILLWAYTLLLPSMVESVSSDQSLLTQGPLGIGVLRPQALLGLDLPPLVHGVLWSLGANIAAYLAFSAQRRPSAIEQLQANVFVLAALAPTLPSFRLRRSAVSVEELIATVARYVGEERTRNSFASFALERDSSFDPQREADFHLINRAEHLLASAIGAASSRLVLSLLLRKRTLSTKAALKLLDDANAAIQYNREILQTALDHVGQGIAVFDKNRDLTCWNRRFGEILDLPPHMLHVGTSLEKIVRFNADRAGIGRERVEEIVRERTVRYVSGSEPSLERIRSLVIEVRSNPMPDGGRVTTWTDITPSVAAAEALERANETLERRVNERTEELTRLNAALARAKAQAEKANLSKTHFLAAASHDILQPLNAARLYAQSVIERHGTGEDRDAIASLDASLESVEEILSALLDISRLDAGAMKPEIGPVRVNELFRHIELEFEPLARAKGLDIDFVPCGLAVCSDRRLLRRLLQNLISNAVKYTSAGRVLVGCRRRGSRLRIEVHDTGIGIPAAKTKVIFREFHRLDQAAKIARGLGLGLSIVERIARVLDHPIELRSRVGRGSHFAVTVPVSSVQPRAIAKSEVPLESGQLVAGSVVLCIDNEPQVLDGMETLLATWGCRALKAGDLETAHQVLSRTQVRPDGLLIDYHLDGASGIEAIAALRSGLGDLPAALVTADHSPRVRQRARAQDIRVLHKPVKPAALRALLAQWQIQKVAAE
jgi:Na+/proline symporter/signal transduction histidine kinase